MHTTEETHEIQTKHHRLIVQSFRAKADARRTLSDKFADKLTAKFGTVLFLGLNAAWFLIWIVMNTGLIPGLKPFDPFPFGLLTMIVSLEAIFLAIIVLISQNRAARIAELREEVDLQINSIAETEISKIITLVALLMEKNGIKLDDPDIADMARPIRSSDIQRMLEKQLK
ncbi:MAG: DUF1003 domain-containing protein [Candidatus Saccharimonadaceae bacterium]